MTTYISPHEILKGRDVEFPLDHDLKANLDILLVAVNKLRAYWGKPLIVTSGYRPGHHNRTAGGAPESAHIYCQAVDFRDTDGDLARFLIERLDVLEDCGLYIEDPSRTPGWLHCQTRAPKSGARIFKP